MWSLLVAFFELRCHHPGVGRYGLPGPPFSALLSSHDVRINTISLMSVSANQNAKAELFCFCMFSFNGMGYLRYF